MDRVEAARRWAHASVAVASTVEEAARDLLPDMRRVADGEHRRPAVAANTAIQRILSLRELRDQAMEMAAAADMARSPVVAEMWAVEATRSATAALEVHLALPDLARDALSDAKSHMEAAA